MVQNACDLLELERPTLVMISSDQTVRTLRALAQREGYDLARRAVWPVLTARTSFSATATESQGAMTTIASDFNYIIPGTMWNDTQNKRIMDATSAQEWSAVEGYEIDSTWPHYRIYGGTLYIKPAPTASDSIIFEYQSANWCQSSVGTGQSAWAADDDTGILPEKIMEAGLVWRFKQANGLDYAEDFMHYERLIANELGRSGSAPKLDAANDTTREAGVIVPAYITV